MSADRYEERLNAIADLEDGWYGEGTLATDPSLIAWVREHRDAWDIPSRVVSVIPLGDGCIEIEFEDSDNWYSVELYRNGEMMLYVDQLRTDEQFSVTTIRDVAAMRQFIETGQLPGESGDRA